MAQSQAERDHGTLKQGYKMLPKYHWDFPCSVHEGNAAARLTQTYKKLEAERKKRDFDLTMPLTDLTVDRPCFGHECQKEAYE